MTATAASASAFDSLSKEFDARQFLELNKRMTFAQYYDVALQNPFVCFSAWQRTFDMILLKGIREFRRYNRPFIEYKFFSKHKEFPIFGLEKPIECLVNLIKGAAGYFGTEKRILLLHGPVGSSKSTVARAIKRGLEEYSRTDRGAMYSFAWTHLDENDDIQEEAPCPMHDDPLKLIPMAMRAGVEKKLNARLSEMKMSDDSKVNDELHRILKIKLNGDLNPHDTYFMEHFLNKYHGDWKQVIEKHIEVRRIVISEARRVGIGTFQPKDEKNQDATELTGDVNYMKLGKYGKDSDARAFNFDGEFEVANRGCLEMIEMLKLNPEFLYDLLGAAQEQQVKPKKFPQVSVDLMIIGHTNSPEYRKFEKNEAMEALRDRTVRVDWPYCLRWQDEIEILKQDYNTDKVRQHIAPHTIETAALVAILSRLTVEKDANLTPVNKAELYNGKSLPGFTDDSIKELMDRDADEGLGTAISARYIQNKISNSLVRNYDYVNPFMVLREIEEGLHVYAHVGDDEGKRAFYKTCVDLSKKKLEEELKYEVRKALVMDDDLTQRTFTNYIDNVFAYIDNEKVQNEYTGDYEEPNEQLMRSIEDKIEVPENHVDEFRRTIAAYCGKIQRNEGPEALKWDRHPDLAKALELKIFEELKDSVKLSSLTKITGVIDPATKQKIEDLTKRLISQYGYNEQSAKDVLQHVASIFARGDIKEND